MQFNRTATSLLMSLTSMAGGQERQQDLWTVLSVQLFSSWPMCTSGHLLNPASKPRSRAGAASDKNASPTFPWAQLYCEKKYFPSLFLPFLHHIYWPSTHHKYSFSPMFSFGWYQPVPCEMKPGCVQRLLEGLSFVGSTTCDKFTSLCPTQFSSAIPARLNLKYP